MGVPFRQVRARYTADTITVYQAYPAEIAVPALAAGRFVAPFKRDRMTWIKPSFLWMMYRCGWGFKPGQERVLAVEIRRSGFEWALAAACLSHFDRDLHPDRDAGSRVPLAGLYGGGLHRLTADGWTLDVVGPDWPAERVILSEPSGHPYGQPDRGGWQVIHDETACELRAAGFSSTGATLVIASSCAITIFTRA